MIDDVLEGMWKQVKGEVKKTWGRLTDDDVQQIEGNKDILVGKIQEKYGYTKNRAEEEVNDFLDNFDNDDYES
jgi:uncharacterized protein YjbJ (UPF0337 family)